jgi:magnesium transporter
VDQIGEEISKKADLPDSFVGLFGQNFHFTKEIEYHWGWPVSIVVIAVITYGQVVYFKRKNWL